MEAIGTWDSAVSSEDLWAFVGTIPDGLSYSKTTRSTCESQLGIPGNVIDDEWQNHKSAELQTSIRNYESVITKATQDKDNSWLEWVQPVLECRLAAKLPHRSIHFALLPCIKVDDEYLLLASAVMLILSRDTIRSLKRCCKIRLLLEVSHLTLSTNHQSIQLNYRFPDTLYYSLWIEINADETYVDEYDSKRSPAIKKSY